jgi:hypothetical protein
LSGAVKSAWQQVSEVRSLIYSVCEEFGFHEASAMIKLHGGRANAWRGDREQGQAEITEAIEKLNSVGSFVLSSGWGLILLAQVQLNRKITRRRVPASSKD